MKGFFYLLGFLLPATCCLAQDFTLNRGGTSSTNYYQELPYTTVNGKMFVMVEFAGNKYRFLFDTGSPVLISNDLAALSGAPILHREQITDAFGGKDTALVVGLDSLRLGDLVFDSVPALKGIPGFYKCWEIEGVVGSNLLRNSIVRIDPIRKIIVLTDRLEKLPQKNNEGIPMVTDIGAQSDPKIKIGFGKKADGLVGFDTGDADFLRFSEEYMNELRRTGAYTVIWKGYGAHSFSATGGDHPADKYLLKFPVLTLNGCLFKNAIVETNKGGSAAIGAKLLDYGSVTLDFLHRRFYFDAANPDSNDLYEKKWPFEPSIDGDRLVIGVIWDNGFNEVRPGQQIIAVDEFDCSHMDLCDVLNKKPLLEGKDKGTITIKDDRGNTRKIQIAKE